MANLTYDLGGRRTQMVDATGTSSWTYDNGDRLTALNQPQGNLTYNYDQWGRRTKLTEVAGTNYTNTNYTAHRLTSVQKFPENETTGWVYDTYGRLTRQNNSNGTYALYGYDGLDRLNSLVHKKSDGTVLTSEDYVYDQAGNLTSKTVDGVTTTYGYDNIDQLTSESRPGCVCSYAYHSNGNPLKTPITKARYHGRITNLSLGHSSVPTPSRPRTTKAMKIICSDALSS